MCKKYKAYLYYQHHCAHIRNVYNAHKPYTERDIHQTDCFSPICKANGPNLRIITWTNRSTSIACRDLGNDDSLYCRPCWSHMAVECSDVGSNSSLSLSWFDLSTPGYDLSNKAWRGWGNHVLVNRSVLRHGTSRTVCVSNHLGGRSSVGSHDYRFPQHIVFHFWCML